MIKKFYTEIDPRKNNENLEPIRIRGSAGHELIDNFRNLQPYFRGGVKLAMPDLLKQGDDILKVKYLVSEGIEPAEVGEEEFHSNLKAKVKNAVDELHSQAAKLGKSRDDRQKISLLNSFQLADDFDTEGYKHLRKAGSNIILTNWGFRKMPAYSIDTTGYGEPEIGPDDTSITEPAELDNARLIITGIGSLPDYEESALDLNVHLDTKLSDLKYQWNIGDNEFSTENNKELKLTEDDLSELADEFSVKVRVENAENPEISDEYELTSVKNPLTLPEGTEAFPGTEGITKTESPAKSFWEEYKTLIIVALLVLLGLILLMWFLNRDPDTRDNLSGSGSGETTTAPATPGGGANGLTQGGDRPGSESSADGREGSSPSALAPSSEGQNEIAPYDNRIDDGAPLPAPKDEFREQLGDDAPTEIGTVYEHESDAVLIRWIELHNGQTFVLDYVDKTNMQQQAEPDSENNIQYF